MKQRVITGVVGALLLLFALLVNVWVTRIAVAVILFLCMHEMLRAMHTLSKDVHVFLPYTFAVLLLPTMAFFSLQGVCFLLSLCVIAQFFALILRDEPGTTPLTVNFLPFVYPGIPAVLLQRLTLLEEPLPFLLILFVSSFLSDCFALFFGMTFGKEHKHRLIPRVSPNKTVEGCIGGFVGGVLFTCLLGVILRLANLTDLPLWQFALMGFVGSLFTQFGDLAASFIKRACGIKDFGAIMPGHGGMLDRMDGVLFNASALCLYAALILGLM